MARIPDDQIERLKTDVSLVRLVEAKGIALKRQGKDWLGHCPFHDDKTPSLVVSPEQNLWHCLGACQCGGSVIDWVMKCEGVSFRHAVELLRGAEYPSPPVAHTPTKSASEKPVARAVARSTSAKLPALLASDSDAQALLQQVIDYYHSTLKQSPEALAYLDQRGLNNAELIAHFKLGYANRTLGYHLPAKTRVEGAVLRGRLEDIGVYRASGHEHLNGSLVVPVLDAQGNISDVYGRKIQKALRAGTPLHLYLPGPHRGVFNVAGLHDQTDVILCEALIDALTFWAHGFRNVTASYGVEGFTAAHVQAFKQHNIKRVLIAYDRDEAGDKAAEKLAAQLCAEGFECFRVLFPRGLDANAYALTQKAPAEALGALLRKAEWVGAAQGGSSVAPMRTEPVRTVPERTKPVRTEPERTAPEQSAPLVPKPPSLAAAVPPVLPAAPVPEVKLPAPASASAAEHIDGDLHIAFGDRRYRVRGHSKNPSPEHLKINLQARNESGLFIDTLDLYSAKARALFIKQASLELGVSEEVLKADVGKVLLHLESLQDAKPKEPGAVGQVPSVAPVLDAAAQTEALALLQSPDLLQRILDDFAACGVVGEETNKLVGYLACVSRKLDKPLALIIQSSSAAGKSSLMDAVLQFMPEEERVQYSAMTGQSLFYMGESNLKHKILAIAEEEGASKAAYALKLLQSEGALTMASTGKDENTGNLVTRQYRVEGPVMLFLTTTAIDIDEELLNRCLVLSVNESREQTRAIHTQQRARRTLAGLQARVMRERIIAVHANAQRLLRPLAVINPYADQLSFHDSKTRSRRDHEKYLSLIDSIALLHQHQRSVQTLMHGGAALDYIEVTAADIAMANQLAHEVLGRSLDELPPQTRRLLESVQAFVSAQCDAQAIKQSDFRFSRRLLREHTGWGETQLRLHLDRLTQMEYLIAHRGMRGQSFVYELSWDGAGGTAAHMPGLIDIEALGSASVTTSSRGSEGEFAGSTRPQRGGMAGGSRLLEIEEISGKIAAELPVDAKPPKTAKIQQKTNGLSYVDLSADVHADLHAERPSLAAVAR